MILNSNTYVDIDTKIKTKDMDRFVYNWISILEENIPLDSHVEFRIFSKNSNQENSAVVANLNVFSRELEINVKIVRDDVYSTLDDLFKEVEKQVRRWRILRFMPQFDCSSRLSLNYF